jgi:serine/threonine-protein kinase HipA
MSQLCIWVGSEHAATLESTQDSFALTYTESWAKSQQAFAFSPHLPLNSPSGQDTQGAAVKHFFSNLLPEGRPLEALSFAHQVSQYDVFGILRKVGRDCAGALVITDESAAPPEAKVFTASDYEAVTRDQLQERIVESTAQDVPLMFWRGKRRMSLPGVQNKLGVYMAQDGSLWLPKDGAPTSHILKIGNTRHPDMAANEYACMRLAHSIGLPVPQVIYMELPEPVLLVQRYDRTWTPDGGLLRTHQIDACQALNLPPEQKYEEPDYETAPPGPTFAQILALHKLCQVPASAQVLMLQWLLFNFIIGNSDAHAKNFSFLVNEKGLQAAPLYDLVSGLRYGYKDMAQSVGGETHLSVINTEDWNRLAKDCHVPFNLLKRLGKQLTAKIEAKAQALQNQLMSEATGANSNAVQFVCQLAVERAGYLKEHLAGK